MLNAANVNLVAFARFNPAFRLEGQVFALMVIVLAAAEAAVALAIILNFYNNHATVDVDEAEGAEGVSSRSADVLDWFEAVPGRLYVVATLLPLAAFALLLVAGGVRVAVPAVPRAGGFARVGLLGLRRRHAAQDRRVLRHRRSWPWPRCSAIVGLVKRSHRPERRHHPRVALGRARSTGSASAPPTRHRPPSGRRSQAADR